MMIEKSVDFPFSDRIFLDASSSNFLTNETKETINFGTFFASPKGIPNVIKYQKSLLFSSHSSSYHFLWHLENMKIFFTVVFIKPDEWISARHSVRPFLCAGTSKYLDTCHQQHDSVSFRHQQNSHFFNYLIKVLILSSDSDFIACFSACAAGPQQPAVGKKIELN